MISFRACFNFENTQTSSSENRILERKTTNIYCFHIFIKYKSPPEMTPQRPVWSLNIPFPQNL